MSNAPPSRDPANDDSVLGTLKTVLRKHLESVDDCLPCRVIAFNGDRNKPRVTVQPMVEILTTSKQRVGRAQVPSVPVLVSGAGGFLLSFPIKPGDFGYIKANDRDISLVMQSGKDSAPNTLRLHSFADAVFIPSALEGYTISEDEEGRAVFQNTGGTSKISMGDDSIILQVGSEILELSAAGFKHNGVNIGSTHAHGGVESGGSDTDGPH